jgi:hypothetical protein
MRCNICKEELKTTFLDKILGTVVKDAKGKRHHICPECQRKLGSKEEIMKKL